MPTIAELLTAYRDRTGDSYDEMSRRIDDAISSKRLHQLVRQVPRNFPEPRTVEALALLLQMPVATIVLAFASSLGIAVKESSSRLARSLPPGTDNLTARDEDAILAVTRALVDARRRTRGKPVPDLSEVEGVRLDETNPSLRVVEPQNGPQGT